MDNRLTFIEYVNSKNGRRFGLYKCTCGNLKEANIQNVKRGYTKSCGCISKERPSHTIHGMSNTSEFSTWSKMKARCLNLKDKKYKDYGGRGITICDRWINSFENFYLDMGDKPKANYSIERIDVNGNYEPENCKWADEKTQARNRRNTKYITINDLTKSAAEWCDLYGISYDLFDGRIRIGWDCIKAITTPKLK